LRSSNGDIELVVIDNDSQDETVPLLGKLLATYTGAQLTVMPENVGFARAVNHGLRMASGEFVVVLNPDCYVTPTTLSDMVAVMESDPRIGIAGCLLLNEDGSEQAGCRRYIPTPWRSLMRVLHLGRIPFLRGKRIFGSFIMSREPLPDRPQDVEALSGALMMVRPESMAEVGLFDEAYFMHCEDLDWCMRFRSGGWRVVFVPTTHAVHAKGGSTRSRPLRVEYYKHAGMIRFYRRHLRHRYPYPLMVLVVAAVWVRFLFKAIMLLPQSFVALRRGQRIKSDQMRGRLGVRYR